jgi:hypothetical protein
MITETIIVAILSLVGTLAGTFGGIMTSNRLTGYRIEQLEKQVEKHNSVIERVQVLEDKNAFQDEKLNKIIAFIDEYKRKGA